MQNSRVRDAWTARCFIAACALMVIGSSAGAQSAPTKWQWSITPYSWIADTKGTVGAGDAVSNVDLSAGDLVKSVDVVLMAAFEGRRDRWLGHLDLFYVSTSDDADLQAVAGVPGTVKVESYQTMLAPEAGYTVFRKPKVVVDAVAGLRYWHVKSELTATLPTGSGSGGNDANWVDGIVGADVTATPWGPRWHLLGRADLGAGGSDFTWQVLGGAAYDFAHCCSIDLIYRHLDVDYESDKLIQNVYMTGPAIGVGFKF